MDQFIKGTTKLLCLLGDPVGHSLSPQIHNHALRTLELPYAYMAFAVPSRSLHTVVSALRAINFGGANVTIPHKSAVTHCCDILSPLSQVTGTVNTLYVKDGLLHGDTTDPAGFLRALEAMGHNPLNGHCVILGNGGTARTLATALALKKLPQTITLIGRNEFRVASLVNSISSATGFQLGYSTFANSSAKDILARCTLLVNCTSVGMHPDSDSTPLDKSFFHSGMTVFDTIYNPQKTRFLSEAQASGCAVQNGLRMLLFQALASFKLWTGVDVNDDIYDLEQLAAFATKR